MLRYSEESLQIKAFPPRADSLKSFVEEMISVYSEIFNNKHILIEVETNESQFVTDEDPY